jgi:hypothetical protein
MGGALVSTTVTIVSAVSRLAKYAPAAATATMLTTATEERRILFGCRRAETRSRYTRNSRIGKQLLLT